MRNGIIRIAVFVFREGKDARFTHILYLEKIEFKYLIPIVCISYIQ